MAIVFAPFRPDDALLLHALQCRAVEAIGDRFYSIDEREGWIRGFSLEAIHEAAENGEAIEIARVDDAIAGYCGDNDGCIQNLFVDPAYQRRGVGSALVLRALDRIRTEGRTQSFVHASLVARSVYSRAGFTIEAPYSHVPSEGTTLAGFRMAYRHAGSRTGSA